jgi:phosphodiesterase/alkaline phosphatase D-like protein
MEAMETRQLLSVSIPLLNGNFQSPTWVTNDNVNYFQQAVAAGTQALNYNQLDPRFGPPGWAKTAQAGGGPGPNGEGLYNERNDLGYNQFYNYVNGQLPAPASGVNFFNIEASPTGGTYHIIVDQQPNTTGDAGNHGDINYPPMIDATTAKAGHTYQVSVALGNPLINGSTAELEANVELDFTLNAGTYYEPSGENSYNYATGQTNAPESGDTSLDYSGYGTTVASAFAYGNSSNWALAPGTFQTLTLTWTCPASDAGMPLDMQVIFNCYNGDSVSMSNVQLTDLTALTTVPPAPTGVTAAGASSSQINLNWNNVPGADTYDVYQGTTSGGESSTPIATGITGTSYSVTGLNASSTYYYTVAAVNNIGTGSQSSEASAATGSVGTPVSVTVPDGNFAADATQYYIGNNSGGGSMTSTVTGTLAGWSLSAVPSTASSGGYNWLPVAGVDSVNSSGASPWSVNAAAIGNQPASSYKSLVYYPGEQYAYNNVVSGAQPGASFTMTTTGISANAVAGATYTAGIQYGNVSFSGASANPSANVQFNILANGAVVSSSFLTGLAQAAPWTGLTVGWVVPSAFAGDAIQLQVIANNFLEGPAQWDVPTFAFANATLTSITPANLPAAPSGLTATTASASQINLAWTDNSNNETGFKIDQATNSTFTTGLTTVTVGANVTTYNATGLLANTTYYYRVRATNGNGDSANTSTANATTQNAIPAAPSGLTATAASSTQINLGWTDNSNNETGFKIDQATDSGFTQNLTTVTVGANVTTYSATGLSTNTTYYYRVRSTNTLGDSANTSTASATTQVATLTAPSGLTATAVSSSQINLGWTDNSNNETGFKIDQATDSGFTQNFTTVTVGANVTTYNATGLSSNTTYYYRVRATNANGDSANTSTASATTTATGTPVSIPVPDGDFTDTPGYYINSNTGGGTFTSPMNGTLSGWSLSGTPSTANGGNYAGWEPYGVIDNVTSGGGTTPFSSNVSSIGNPPASNYQTFLYYPGELYGNGSVVGGAQLGAKLTMTTTGINAAAVTGTTYTASILYSNVSWPSANVNPSANVALNILANGVVVGTGTLSGLAQGSPWTTVTANWTAASAEAGQAIQLQVVATNFLEGPTYQWDVPTFGFAHATLTATAVVGIPAAPSGLTATAASPSQINLSWTDNSSNETGFKIDQATNSTFTVGLTTVTVGANVTTYNATGLSSGTTYYYRVRATNASGDSANTTTASATTAVTTVITVPDGDFADAAGYVINSNTGPATFTSPMNGTLSGWTVSGTPSSANGGQYTGWEPYGLVDNVPSGGAATPYSSNVSFIGNQPASNYQAFIYYPGELYNNGSVVGGAQPGAGLTMTTTGISAAVVTGTTYTATIDYANVSWGPPSGATLNPSANVALNILANGVVVGTGTLSGMAQNSPWTTVTASWTATAAHSGQAIQLQVVANNFLEGPASTNQWQVPTIGFTHATLTSSIVSTGTLPAWLSPGSAAVWNASSHSLVVTGPSTITADPGTDEPIISADGAAVVTINTGSTAPVNIGAINLTNGASVVVSDAGVAQVLVVQTGASNFTIDSTSKFDLGKNYLDLQNIGGNIGAIDTLLKSGFGNGTWNGDGLTSSDAATDPTHLTALGSIVNGGQFSSTNKFEGVTPGSNDILVHDTYYGDADLSGTVTGNDYSLIDAGFGGQTQTPTSVSINVPDGSFEQASTSGQGPYPNLSVVFGGTPQNPASWGISTSASSLAVSSPGPGPAAEDGNQFLTMWPGETTYYDNNNGISTVVNSTFTITTTGITDTVVAGRNYTAAVAVDLPGYSWSLTKPSSYFDLASGTVSAAYQITLLANGSPVATGTLPMNSLTANTWQDVIANWTAPAGTTGQSLQVQVEVYNFTQGPTHTYEPQAAIDNIRLSYASSVSTSLLKIWQNGDFNYDGSIDGSDYSLIDNAFNQQAAVPMAEVATSAAQIAPVSTHGKPSSAVISSALPSSSVFASTGTIAGSGQVVDDELDSWQPKRSSMAIFVG